MKRSIALIGFMCAGKTTVGRLLADALNVGHADTDDLVAEREGARPDAIFAEKGEEAFRAAESVVLRELCTGRPQVISCGGGAVTREENRKILKENCFVILLDISPETALERACGSGEKRPLLDKNSAAGLLEQRRAAYEATADAVVPTDGRTPEDICNEIIDLLQTAGYFV